MSKMGLVHAPFTRPKSNSIETRRWNWLLTLGSMMLFLPYISLLTGLIFQVTMLTRQEEDLFACNVPNPKILHDTTTTMHYPIIVILFSKIRTSHKLQKSCSAWLNALRLKRNLLYYSCHCIMKLLKFSFLRRSWQEERSKGNHVELKLLIWLCGSHFLSFLPFQSSARFRVRVKG